MLSEGKIDGMLFSFSVDFCETPVPNFIFLVYWSLAYKCYTDA